MLVLLISIFPSPPYPDVESLSCHPWVLCGTLGDIVISDILCVPERTVLTGEPVSTSVVWAEKREKHNIADDEYVASIAERKEQLQHSIVHSRVIVGSADALHNDQPRSRLKAQRKIIFSIEL